MKTFDIHLQSPSRYEHIVAVRSFVGLDASGSFGILASHERTMTILVPGIMRFYRAKSEPEYLGMPGGVLYFANGQLYINTLKYLRGSDHAQLQESLKQQIDSHKHELAIMTETIRRMEESMLMRLIREPEERIL